MKNIEIILATKSTFPMLTKTKAKATVTRVAFSGSLFLKLPLANKEFRGAEGNISSAAKAFKVRGATMIVPRAEEMDAQARPIGIIGPQTAILDMTS